MVEEDAAVVAANAAAKPYPDQEVVRALEAMFEESFALVRRLRAAGEDFYGKNVLRVLDRMGPQTVPQLARSRQCSRQNVRLLVNDLVSGGYVELIENPAHRRSHLVSLAPRGRAFVESMRRREAGLLQGLEISVPASDLRAAASVLRAVRGVLENAPAPSHDQIGH